MWCSRTVFSSFQGTTLQKWVRPYSSDSGMVAIAPDILLLVVTFCFPCFGTHSSFSQVTLYNCTTNVWIAYAYHQILVSFIKRMSQIGFCSLLLWLLLSLCLFDTLFSVYVIEGDVVEAVVPHMGESITDGTLANFLKSMFFFAFFIIVFFIPVHVEYVSNIFIKRCFFCCSCRTW